MCVISSFSPLHPDLMLGYRLCASSSLPDEHKYGEHKYTIILIVMQFVLSMNLPAAPQR